MFTPDQLNNLNQSEMEKDFEFAIPSGDDSDSLWQDMVNLRPQIDGRYVFSKFRGGTTAIETQDGTIQTESFTVDLGQGSEKYYVIVDGTGKVYLKPDGAAKYQIFSGFTPGERIDFHLNGKFLYAFEHGGAFKKYHDINVGDISGSYEFHANTPTRITSATLGGSGKYEEDNIFGFNEGHVAIIIPARFDANGFNAEDMAPFTARINEVRDNTITYKNADVFESVQTVSAGTDSDNILPYNDELEDLVGTAARQQITIYRAYMVVDMLDDGSTMIPSRPEIVQVNETSITSNRVSNVRLEMSAASSNVEKRFLLATRWQYTLERVFEPTSERHPNGPFYICGDISKSQQVHVDKTPDRLLIRPLSEVVPLRAGVPMLLHHGSIDFNTSTSFKGSLITGDYTLSRPVPLPHTSKNTPGNCFATQELGTPLGEVRLAFEYTDGKKSNVVGTGVQCTDSKVTLLQALDPVAPYNIIEIGALRFDSTSGDDDQGGDPFPGEGGDPDGNSTPSGSFVDDRKGYVNLQFPSHVPGGGVQNVLVNFTSSDTSFSLTNKIITAVQTGITGYSATLSPTISSGNYQIKIMKDETGPGGNGDQVIIDYSKDYVTINNSVASLLTVSLEGGMEGDGAVEKASSKVQVYGLNALVSKVFVLIGSKLYREITPGDSYFNGHPLRLLADSIEISNLPDFTPWGADQVQTQVTISSGLTLSIPFQQFRIDRQYRAHSSYAIQKLIPLRFDSDRTQLRYQLMAITDSDVQLGYLTGQGDTFEAIFEPTDDSVEITDPKRIKKVNGQTFVRTEEGLHRFGQGGLELILPRDRYDVLTNDLYDVAYNTRHGEYWFCFGTPIVLVFKNGLWYQMRYPVDVFSLQFAFGAMSIGVTNGLYKTDDESLFTDVIGSSFSIKADLVSKHLGNELTQMRLFDFQVNGLGANAELFLDSQLTRYEGDNNTWQKVFDTTYSFSSQALSMNGAIWEIHERAIMPRLKVEATALQSQALISNSVLKGYITDNKNVARI